MTAKFFRSVFALTLVTALPLVTALHAAIPPAESLLPADTLVMLTVPDFAALRAAGKQSPQMLFCNSDAMAPFREKFIAKLTGQYLGPLESDLGVKLADFAELPQGQLTFAVTKNGWDGGNDATPGLLLLLDARDKSSLLATNLAKLRQKWTDSGKTIRTETLHGITFSVVPLTSNNIPNSLAGVVTQPQPVQELGKETTHPKTGEFVFGQYQSLLIVGSSVKAVEPVIARLTGGSPALLADNSQFAADQLSQFRDNPLYYGWFNGKTLFGTLASHEPEAPNPQAPSPFPQLDPRAILNATGLNALKSASFALHEDHEGALATVHFTAPESERAGLFKMFAFSPKEAGVPPFVPADAIKFSRIRLSGHQVWDELQKVVAAISPQGLASLNAVIDMANTLAQTKTPGFDVRTALIGNLGDDIITYQKAPVDNTPTAQANPPSLVLVAVANADQSIDAIKMLASLAAQQEGAAAPRDFLGHKIHTIALRPTVNPATGASTAHALYVSSSGGYAALSTDSAILEEFLRSADGNVKTLHDLPGLTEAAQHVGGTGGGLFGYENQQETVRNLFQLMKNSSSSTFNALPPAYRDWLDFSLLPDFNTVSKYFGISVYGGNLNSEGLTFKVYTPHPPLAR